MLKKKTKKTKVCFHCNEIGHLVKVCPLIETEKSDILSEKCKRIEFKNESDIENFKKRIQGFKLMSCRYVNMQPILYQPILKELLFYLSIKYGYQKKFLLHPQQVKLAFTNNFRNHDSASFQFAETSALSGYITFSTSAIEDKLVNATESGYENEQHWIKKWCKNKEEFLFWILLHEFSHLFDGFNNDRHEDSFFEHVDKLAHENDFLFI